MLSNKPKVMEERIVEEDERYIEIYKIICNESKKWYIGQTVSHILNRGKYVKYGYRARFNGHISEAFSGKKNQCHYLNAAIRKYGKDAFSVELLDICFMHEGTDLETKFILTYDTLFPNGYNLKLGTETTYLSLEGRKRVSSGLVRYYQESKLKRFKDANIDENNLEQYIKVLKREGKPFGYYVLVNGLKADFGGIHISLEDSYNAAMNFLREVKARQLVVLETPKASHTISYSKEEERPRLIPVNKGEQL